MGVRRDNMRSSAWEVLEVRCLMHRQVVISNKRLLHMSESHRKMWTKEALELSKDALGVCRGRRERSHRWNPREQ